MALFVLLNIIVPVGKMKENGVKIGEIHTSLAIDGLTKDGPRMAAEELFSLINE